jgi:hypothetical protein
MREDLEPDESGEPAEENASAYENSAGPAVGSPVLGCSGPRVLVQRFNGTGVATILGCTASRLALEEPDGKSCRAYETSLERAYL